VLTERIVISAKCQQNAEAAAGAGFVSWWRSPSVLFRQFELPILVMVSVSFPRLEGDDPRTCPCLSDGELGS